jgi:Flp pilus assembly pilin Flp
MRTHSLSGIEDYEMMNKLKTMMGRMHRDEKGADLVEYVLIIAAVALPVLGIIIWFKEEIGTWIGTEYDEVKDGDGGTDPR